MDFSSTLPVRRLVSTVLYLCSATMFIANLGYTRAAGFDAVDLGLAIAGVGTWILAGSHSTYRRVKALKPEHEQPEENIQLAFRSSTHSAINAALYSTSAIFFIAGDAYNTTTSEPVRALRLSGSILWLISSATYGWLSMAYERKQENHAELTVLPLGVRPEVYYFANEAEYLSAGVLYAAAIYLSNPIPAFKAAGNACWLLASTHETGRTLWEMTHIIHQKDVDIETPAPQLNG